jgi:hypothetical protein
MTALWGVPATERDLGRELGRLSAVAGADLLVHGDGPERGVRIVRLRAGDLEAEVALDRGLDLPRASFRGLPIGWMSPTGVVGPWYAEPAGFGPLRTFFGGLLTTCGLDHAFAPAEADASAYGYPPIATEHRPLHGRVSTTPATLRGYGVERRDDALVVFVEGDVVQARLFGEHLRLRRRIELPVGAGVIAIADQVTNLGQSRTPHLMAYHVNFGWPLVSPTSEVTASLASSTPFSAAAEGQDWRRLGPMVPSPERVWRHAPVADAEGWGRASIVNRELLDGHAVHARLRWSIGTLPALLQWSVPRAGHRVIGLEPTNVDFDARPASGVWLEPGEVVTHRLELALRADAGATLPP